MEGTDMISAFIERVRFLFREMSFKGRSNLIERIILTKLKC